MCLVTYRDNTHQVKLTNQGIPGIWVGYADGHPTGTYWVFNPGQKDYSDPRCDASTEVIG